MNVILTYPLHLHFYVALSLNVYDAESSPRDDYYNRMLLPSLPRRRTTSSTRSQSIRPSDFIVRLGKDTSEYIIRRDTGGKYIRIR